MPEIRQNLDRIDARVARMTELTRGIMEFSRIGTYDYLPEPLSLADAVESMAADFGFSTNRAVGCTRKTSLELLPCTNAECKGSHP